MTEIISVYKDPNISFEQGLALCRIAEGVSYSDINNELEWLAHEFRKAGIEE